MKKGFGIALAGLLLTTGCLGNECDEAWQLDLMRGIVCGGDAARCAQVNQQPDRELRFTANVATTNAQGKPLSAEALKARATCVSNFIRQRNVSDVVIATDNTSVTAVTTYRRVAPVFEFRSVASFAVDCGGAMGCADCAPLPAAACEDDAFCSPLSAQPFNAQNQCLQPTVVAGCHSAEQACDASLTWGTSPSTATPPGACHLFNSGCLPAGWGPGTACPAAATPPACAM